MTLCPPNQIELAVAAQFGDPALWSRYEPVRMRVEQRIGLLAGFEQTISNDKYVHAQGNSPEQRWVALLYGSRMVDDTGRRYGPANFETTTLRTMTEIHAYLAATVLASEGVRPSVLVDPPVISLGAVAKHPDNNRFWLQKIVNDKVWPIMAINQGIGEQKVYYSHDYTDEHNAVCLTLPIEAQDLITQVGTYQLEWMDRHEAGEVPEELWLPGDYYMLAHPENAGGLYWLRNGINLIDGLTDSGDYMHLLHYLMYGNGTTPSERLRVVEACKAAPIRSVALLPPIQRAAIGLAALRGDIGRMANFIHRHRYGENLTPEAAAAESTRVIQGVVRMARTILGGDGVALPTYAHHGI